MVHLNILTGVGVAFYLMNRLCGCLTIGIQPIYGCIPIVFTATSCRIHSRDCFHISCHEQASCYLMLDSVSFVRSSRKPLTRPNDLLVPVDVRSSQSSAFFTKPYQATHQNLQIRRLVKDKIIVLHINSIVLEKSIPSG